jgi:hypothetical protein
MSSPTGTYRRAASESPVAHPALAHRPNRFARYGTMPIRYILKDNYGLLYFRNLDEVESRLNRKAKQS